MLLLFIFPNETDPGKPYESIWFQSAIYYVVSVQRIRHRTLPAPFMQFFGLIPSDNIS